MSHLPPNTKGMPRRREAPGRWGYDQYEHSSPYGYRGNPPPRGSPHAPGMPPPGFVGSSPPQYPPSEYYGYGYEPPPRAYWGGSPYDAHDYPPPVDRSMPPPPRGPPRGPLRLSLSYEEAPISPNMNSFPTSPGAYYHRGPPPSQPKHSDFLPPSPPAAVETHDGESDSKEESDQIGDENHGSKRRKRKNSNPLSVLANVSADMDDEDGTDGKKQKTEPQAAKQGVKQTQVPVPAPTSPLQRRSKPSPITPVTSSPGSRRPQRNEVTPARSLAAASSWDVGPDPAYTEPLTPPSYYPPRRRYPGASDFPPSSPALVEQRSFESQGEYRPYGPPPPSYPYDEYHYGGHWDVPPPYQPRYHYEWNGFEAPFMEDPYYRGHAMPMPPQPMSGPPPVMTQPYPPPYSAVQQPRLEDKTILRKKFSWKHFPELERFLIANRDEYLKHSNMNYTAEQKQYNNWLTEQLLEVAGQHNYMFDPEEFNFVAIRDRIRCYYKSYVQTARKRGLKLPVKKKD